jgi:cytochrome subunit of sulfide dehydrogenase
MKLKIWLVAILLIASVSLPVTSNAAEVIVSTDTLSNTSHIRTLAASCAACHGTQGNSAGSTPVLAGLDSAYFIQQMTEFRSGARSSTVMHRHAKGINVDEINLLANYFSQQKRTSSQPPKAQTLKAQTLKDGHEN